MKLEFRSTKYPLTDNDKNQIYRKDTKDIRYCIICICHSELVEEY